MGGGHEDAARAEVDGGKVVHLDGALGLGDGGELRGGVLSDTKPIGSMLFRELPEQIRDRQALGFAAGVVCNSVRNRGSGCADSRKGYTSYRLCGWSGGA